MWKTQIESFFYLEAKTCVDGPCLNGGLCNDNVPTPGFTCNCPYTYHGIICEKGKQTKQTNLKTARKIIMLS